MDTNSPTYLIDNIGLFNSDEQQAIIGLLDMGKTDNSHYTSDAEFFSDAGITAALQAKFLSLKPNLVNEQQQPTGDTPLHNAIKKQRWFLALFLLDHGARVTIFNNDGKRAFDLVQEYLNTNGIPAEPETKEGFNNLRARVQKSYDTEMKLAKEQMSAHFPGDVAGIIGEYLIGTPTQSTELGLGKKTEQDKKQQELLKKKKFEDDVLSGIEVAYTGGQTWRLKEYLEQTQGNTELLGKIQDLYRSTLQDITPRKKGKEIKDILVRYHIDVTPGLHRETTMEEVD